MAAKRIGTESSTLGALQRAHTWAGPGLVMSMLLAIFGVILALAGETTTGIALLGLGFAAAWPSGIFAWAACRDATEGVVGVLARLRRNDSFRGDSSSSGDARRADGREVTRGD
ncbi:hypothetical protein AB0E59_35695 [Lentzea sp. NPDC034063]|uniref:hypothetical protein n=1 Tax=unclassified Lentzea TaxID=2643253 RepID=UPI0033E015BA